MTQISTDQTPSLFSDPCLSVPSVARSKRGRGATPLRDYSIDIGKPNPAGRRRLKFRFRPHQDWAAERLEQATNLVIIYFRELAGFDTADDAVVRTFYEGLDLYSAEELRWAIAAKAASLAGTTQEECQAKLLYRGRPQTFIARAAYWLEQSPEFQARVAKRRAAAEARQLETRMERLRAAERDRLDEDAAQRAARAREREEQVRAREAAHLAYWDGLSSAQRGAAVKAVRTAFKQQMENNGRNVEDPAFDWLLRAMALDWAQRKWPPAGEHRRPAGPNETRQGAKTAKPAETV